ncbi:MAG: phosphate-starvation-inducible PsiE family protein [Bacillota bacterium]|nr:phosphate-starvation-inducible PsiE family protein [Bacillota bacterium]
MNVNGAKLVKCLDRALHWAVAVGLVAVATAVFAQAVWTGLAGLRHDFMGTILRVVNDLLFVIIVLEVLSTVTSHFEHRDFALKPFLIVGTISVVRHLLMVGARMSMLGEGSASQFQHYVVELGLNGILTLVLVVAYWVTSLIEKNTPPR